MTKIFTVDVQIAGTAYIKAESREEADRKLAEFILTDAASPELRDDGETVSGLGLESPELPEVSLSPAVTVIGVYPGAEFEEQ